MNNNKKQILLTEHKKNDKNENNENLDKYQYLLSQQVQNNEQKLLDFISDKNKLNLNSCFDHKGSEDFLSRKNEAMGKIELNEIIEAITNFDRKEKIKKKKSDIVEKNKNLRKISSEEFTLENKEETDKSKNNLKKTKYHYKSTKIVNNFNFNENKLEEESTGVMNVKAIKESKSIVDKKNKSKKIKEKINNKKKQKNNSKDKNISFESITTVDSKLFNDKKDYERYKHFYVRDDDIFIEEIIGELK